MKVLVTGGAGFIGSALVRFLALCRGIEVIVVDALTYAGDLENISSTKSFSNVSFYKTDIRDLQSLDRVIIFEKPNVIMHLAAESHVDRSINGPQTFLETNILGTYNLLQSSRKLVESQSNNKDFEFRFVHVSTDEVYGDLGLRKPCTTEDSPYAPSSPYSASKASADHLVRAWGKTYGIPFIITNSTNNYGPYQHPEKLIPRCIANALTGQKLPVFGDGSQIRDWIYVEDHVKALYQVMKKGKIGRTYNIGAETPLKNLDVIMSICDVLDGIESVARLSGQTFASLVEYVNDRPGHDFRYELDTALIKEELGWNPSVDFKDGLKRTVLWYLGNRSWWQCKLSF